MSISNDTTQPCKLSSAEEGTPDSRVAWVAAWNLKKSDFEIFQSPPHIGFSPIGSLASHYQLRWPQNHCPQPLPYLRLAKPTNQGTAVVVRMKCETEVKLWIKMKITFEAREFGFPFLCFGSSKNYHELFFQTKVCTLVRRLGMFAKGLQVLWRGLSIFGQTKGDKRRIKHL